MRCVGLSHSMDPRRMGNRTSFHTMGCRPFCNNCCFDWLCWCSFAMVYSVRCVFVCVWIWIKAVLQFVNKLRIGNLLIIKCMNNDVLLKYGIHRRSLDKKNGAPRPVRALANSCTSTDLQTNLQKYVHKNSCRKTWNNDKSLLKSFAAVFVWPLHFYALCARRMFCLFARLR